MRRRLHGRLRVGVAGEALHVQVVRRQRVRVGVVDARRVREALGQRRLLAQRLRKRRVRQRAARVQPLPERVHHADLSTNHNVNTRLLVRRSLNGGSEYRTGLCA